MSNLVNIQISDWRGGGGLGGVGEGGAGGRGGGGVEAPLRRRLQTGIYLNRPQQHKFLFKKIVK